MMNTNTICESTFAKTYKTDAVLVVQGKKVHVNKALLSYHSAYFNKLFNSDSNQKSIKEFPIERVKFEDFATVLSLIHGAPIKYTYEQVESLLEIADRFQLPVAKRYMELFILGQNIENSKERALKLADAFKLNDLLSHVLSLYDRESTIELSKNGAFLEKLSNETIDQLFERMLTLKERTSVMHQWNRQTMSPVDIYKTAFSKSNRTDAILVVGEKKLHVNKTILSHHSDYFDVLFNSEFKEKSMEEIPIKDVNFENFVTLLSFYHSNPIIPTKQNAENILELADRFSLLSTKFYIEPCMIYFNFSPFEAIRIGEKYRLESLYQSGFDRLDITFFKTLLLENSYKELSTDTKLKFFNSYLEFRKVLPNRRTGPSISRFFKQEFAKSDNAYANLVGQEKKMHVNETLPMMNTNTICKSTFDKTNKADAVLVVQGKKLHINKALLSYHSDYFNRLFNSNQKSLKEVPIERVNFEDFAIVLSLIHGAPIKYTYEQVEYLLEIADRFLLPVAKRHIELFILTHEINVKDAKEHVLKWADKFKLNDLISHVLSLFDRESTVELSNNKKLPNELSNETVVKLFEHMLKTDGHLDRNAFHLLQRKQPSVEVYGTAFAKTDKADAILVVGEKKLHVNQAILSHHSDYFKALFNSEFKEKSMEEIPIEDVHFESFVTLLSFYHLNPIIPTKTNAENILELADRFLIPSTKFYMEPYMIQFNFPSLEAIRLGEKYRIDSLYRKGFNQLDDRVFYGLHDQPSYQKLSSDTKRKIFNCYVELCKEPHSDY